MNDKTANRAGPGIGNYDDVEKILPNDYEPLLPPMEKIMAVRKDHFIDHYHRSYVNQ